MKAWSARAGQLLSQPGFVGLLGSTAALGLAFSFVSPFLSLWGTTEVGFSRLQFGLFMTVFSLSAIGLSTVLARWSDTHIPRKIMLLLGSGSGALGFTGYALVRDPLLLVIIGITAVALASICFSQLFASVRERFAENAASPQAGVTVSIVRVCFSFSWTVGPALGAVIMVQHGFTGLFLGAAALYLVFFLGVLRFVPYQPRTKHPSAAVRIPVWSTLKRWDVLACFSAFVLVFAAFSMNTMNLPLVVTQQLGGSERDFGIIFGVGPVVEVPLMLWFGQLATRGYQLPLIRIGALSSVLYFVCLFFARETWHVYFIQIFSGVAFAILTNVAIGFFQDLVPGQAGLATTIFANASNLGNLLGYIGFGALSGILGARGLFSVAASAATVTLIVLTLYRQRPPEAAEVPLAA